MEKVESLFCVDKGFTMFNSVWERVNNQCGWGEVMITIGRTALMGILCGKGLINKSMWCGRVNDQCR